MDERKDGVRTMTDILLAPKTTNPEGHYVVDADSLLPWGDKILLQWELNTDTIKMGKVRLIRPESFKRAHFTGIVLNVGRDVSLDINIGDRLFFEQFSNFEKLYDPKYGRLAFIREQDAVAIVPPRTKINSDGGDYDFDK